MATTGEKKARSTADLIRELEDERTKFTFVCLVVGFEARSDFVWGQGEITAELEKLNSLISSGGEPIGMIGLVNDVGKRSLTVYTRPLAEHAGQDWVGGYLSGLVDSFYAAAVASGMAEPGQEIERMSGWVN